MHMKSLRTSSGDVGQLAFLILILLLFEVLAGQDGQGSSNKELFAGAVGMAVSMLARSGRAAGMATLLGRWVKALPEIPKVCKGEYY